MSRKEKEKQQRRELILSSAREIFLEKGWGATTMDEVARRSEFTKRSVYAYFPSKEELLAALITQALESFHETQVGALDGSLTGFKQVEVLGQVFLEHCTTHGDDMKLIGLSEDLPFPKSFSTFFQDLFRISQENYEILVRSVELGRHDGTINAQLSAKMTAFFLMTCTTAMIKASESLKGPKAQALGFTGPEFLKFGMEFIGMALNPGGINGKKD